jgi:DNA invertase Pin-like site-specific DNA recombinase
MCTKTADLVISGHVLTDACNFLHECRIDPKNAWAILSARPALNDDQIEYVKILKEKGHSVPSIAHSFKVGGSTLYRALQDAA